MDTVLLERWVTGTVFGAVISVTIPGLTNLSLLQVKIESDVTATASTITTTGTLSTLSAVVTVVDIFGQVTNGMLSGALGTESSIDVQISNITFFRCWLAASTLL